MSNRIGVIGDKGSVMIFKLVGFDVRYAENEAEARRHIDDMAKNEYGIIYLTEPLMEQMKDVTEHYKMMSIPAIICIPTYQGTTGFGKKQLEEFTEKAVGQNIL